MISALLLPVNCFLRESISAVFSRMTISVATLVLSLYVLVFSSADFFLSVLISLLRSSFSLPPLAWISIFSLTRESFFSFSFFRALTILGSLISLMTSLVSTTGAGAGVSFALADFLRSSASLPFSLWAVSS